MILTTDAIPPFKNKHECRQLTQPPPPTLQPLPTQQPPTNPQSPTTNVTLLPVTSTAASLTALLGVPDPASLEAMVARIAQLERDKEDSRAKLQVVEESKLADTRARLPKWMLEPEMEEFIDRPWRATDACVIKSRQDQSWSTADRQKYANSVAALQFTILDLSYFNPNQKHSTWVSSSTLCPANPP